MRRFLCRYSSRRQSNRDFLLGLPLPRMVYGSIPAAIHSKVLLSLLSHPRVRPRQKGLRRQASIRRPHGIWARFIQSSTFRKPSRNRLVSTSHHSTGVFRHQCSCIRHGRMTPHPALQFPSFIQAAILVDVESLHHATHDPVHQVCTSRSSPPPE